MVRTSECMSPASNVFIETFAHTRTAMANYIERRPAASSLVPFRSQTSTADPAVQIALKRTIDVVGALLLLLLLSPLLFMLAVVTGFEGGPALFRHRRVGLHGHPFSCLKFRTMCVDSNRALQALLEHNPDARAEWARTHKLKNDPCVSCVGRFLRSTSLDELPQLVNVLRGDMSLVGPRPVTLAELDGEYVRFGGAQAYMTVRPGITGLWQVSGRSGTTYEDRVSLDTIYVSNVSLAADIKILCLTVGAVLRRDGAC